jgi:hypothetical protein
MTFNEFAVGGVILVAVLIPIMYGVWLGQRGRIGEIRCNRCGHAGLAKGEWRAFRGIVPVCGKCQSENWVVQGSAGPPPLPPSAP